MASRFRSFETSGNRLVRVEFLVEITRLAQALIELKTMDEGHIVRSAAMPPLNLDEVTRCDFFITEPRGERGADRA